MSADNLELLLLEKEKRRRMAGPSTASKVGEVAGNVAGTALEAFGAPDQLAGESVRVARDGYPFRLPQVAQRIPGVRDINNRYVTAQQPPSSFVGEVAGGIQGLTQGAIAPLRGMDPLQTAADEIRRPKDTGADAVMQTGLALAGGPVMNAPFDAAAKGVAAVAKPVGKLASLFSSIGTNVKPRNYGVLFNNPGAVLPGRMKAAGEAFEAEAAKLGAGIKGVPSPEKLKALRQPNKYVFDLYDRISPETPINAQRGKLGLPVAKPVTTQQALLGRQMVDAIYPTPNEKNGTYRALLDRIRESFQAIIAEAPEMAKVSKEYSIAKAGSQFHSPVPLTQSGKPGFVRGAAMLEMARRGQFGMAAIGSPAIAGAATAGAGLVAKGLGAVANNEPLKTALLAALMANRKRRRE